MKKLIQLISLLLICTAVLSAQPKWNPVIYTNSATLYGKVTINGVPAQLGDKVGVFVGNECRGVADVVSNLDEGYVSILIQGEVSEEASFRIWKQTDDVVYKVFKTVLTSPGGTIGTPPDYFLIDGSGPDWKPVIYTNSTTLYGLVTINNISAQPGDVVGAFVNGECRGREEVIMNNDTAYVTMLVQGESVENVSFQIWQGSSKKELLVPKQISSDPGGTISFININAVNGLVAFFPFNNNLIDETKNGFDIFGGGLKFVQDRFGNSNSAVAFDGVTSQAEVTNSASLDFPKDGFTISTWVKFKNNTNTVIFGKHVHGYFNGYFLAAVNNQLQFYVSGIPLTTSETFNDNTWHLVTGVYDGANATLYVDGVQKASQAIAYTAMSPNPVRLGYMQTPGYPEKYNGFIDDAKIYNVPLTQSDISTLFSENNWTAQTINVLNPNGENRIKANSIYKIDWTASRYIDSVKIEFTPDDGSKWEVIAPSLPGNSGSFNWRVPRVSTTQAKIRISHLTSGVSAISFVPFYIDLPQVEIASPVGGEYWQVGSTQTITWNASYFYHTNIDYSTDGGVKWNSIASYIPTGMRSYDWVVPNDTTRKAVVRISDADDSTFFDISDSAFTIFQPKLTLLNPIGGERYRLGTTQNIAWTSEYVNKVKIEFSGDNGSNWAVLQGADSVLASLANYSWHPNIETKEAKIRISDAKNSVFISTSNAFEIFVPKISLTSPNGGEQWRTGTSQKISWTSSDVAKVKIQYTTNDGTNWIVAADSVLASIGSFDWTVPSPVTNQAKVRITDYKDVTVSSQSAAPFTIYFPTVMLNSPNGGELWKIGLQKNISWTSTYLTKVKLEYTPDGTTWKLIADQLDANLNNYLWTIPNDPTVNAKVRISDAVNNLVSYTIEGTFTIYQQKLTLTSPLGGERYRELTAQNITWTSEFVNKIKIEFSQDNGANWVVLPGADSVLASLGTFAWTPNAETKQAKIRISDSRNISLQSNSNAFEIYKPKITVTSPNGGEQWIVGTTQSIRWTSSDVLNVKIDYSSNNGTNWIPVISSVPAGDGSYVWTIPNTASPNCKVRISDLTNGSYADTSDNVFSIILPKLTLLKPNGGEIFPIAKTDTIKWTSSNVADVKLEFTINNGNSWIPITNSTPAATGSYLWSVPNFSSTNCKVRISDVTNSLVADTSNNPFTIILPTLTVLRPNGGETFIVGKTDTIKWTSTYVDNVQIQYSTDNSTTWNTIVASTPASAGSFLWTITNTPSTACKVWISDVTKVATSKMSENNFSIVLPKLNVLKPNGGENFVVGKTDTIKWTSSNVENVKIDFSADNGLNWNTIIASTPASTGNFVWTIPNSPSKNCKIRISDVLNAELTDQSDLPFTIIAPTITLLSPNGGEKWLAQTSHEISWTSSDIDSVRIDFSFDNGTTWNVIAPKVFAWDAIYNWNVESLPSSQALIRVSKYNDLSVKDVSDNVFTIYKEALAVTSPNGGEKLRAKTIVPITWNISETVNPKARKRNLGDAQDVAIAPIQNIKIEFTPDNGLNWNTIAASVNAELKSYYWEIPAIESKNCLVRITDIGDATHSDTSDNVFEIYNPKVIVTAPNGGEKWLASSINKISWISSEINKVKIEYSTNDGFEWKIISDSTVAANGSIDWTIPSERTNKARVRVTDISLASTADTSNNSFTIVVPEIRITSPAGGENWKTNTVQQIKWNSLDIELVSVEFSSNNGTTWTMIKDSVLASSGLYNWTIPRTPTEQAKVRLSDVNYKEISAVSNLFSIIKPLALLVPQGGEKWFSGSTHQIKWNFNFVDSVKLEYSLNNGASWLLIANSLPATLLVYAWKIPQNISSAQCRVKITDRNNILTADSSLEVFTIMTPTLTVLTPNGGENLKGGTVYQLTWKNQNSDSLVIDYTIDNGTTWASITKSTNAKTEKLTWTVPKVTSTQCRIRIIDKFYTTVGDTSDRVFSIYTPEISVVTPKGGEIWYVGETKQIKWKSSFVESVKIILTTDDGNSWRILTNSISAADSVFSLFIEKTPSINCRIKIWAEEDSTVIDSSRSNFAIAILPPTIHVSILQNPVLTQYCNVVLVSDSLLSALPTTDVWRTGDNEIPVYEMNPIQNSTNVFECSVKFDTTGIYNFHSRVISKMGIEKDTLRQFAVGVALPNLFAKVTSRNEGLSLAINPGVVEEKTFFSIEEEKINKEIIYNLQPAKTFKKAIGVELSFANETFEEVYKFSVFVLDNGEWKPVPSEVNKKTKTVTASLTTLGKVKLGIDANKKEVIDLPKTFALIQNYPNPFNPSTVITYHLPEDCEFTLEIYNMLGARILTLYSGFAVAGRYSLTWNGMNDANVQVPSGIYLYRLKTNKYNQVRKMILLK